MGKLSVVKLKMTVLAFASCRQIKEKHTYCPLRKNDRRKQKQRKQKQSKAKQSKATAS